ncbi:uncharacterized protein DNG_04272 [Cephalotrichum gorgonifer]|uniref:Beta-glucuronidase C-terminal domain-containing protein n=1 Tax=Cephalotrichum gorgonifer TaxID=2041049 RepID=A0AAE8MYG5_9PEZI|nr:uncharacterized protein DNG_04272 [Cephalotrichum gorgonifer]
MPHLSVKTILAFLACSRVYAQDTTVPLPSRRPEWATKLSPHLAGFSLEMDRWPDWAGQEVGKPNEFFNQVLTNLGERTGHMPFLRVGANSEDRGTVDLSVAVMNATFPKPSAQVPNPEADHIFIGRDFYALSGNLPAGTKFMWGINLKALDKEETVAQARLLAETFQGERAHLTKNVELVNVEIGNEPDFYGPGRRGRPSIYGPEWNVANYTATWVEFAKAVAEEIEFGNGRPGKPTLSPGAFTGFNAPEWAPAAPLIAGLLDDPDLRAITTQFTEHAYSGVFNPNVTVKPGQLMDKATVRSNFTIRTTGRHAVQAMGLTYQLAELNSYANHGYPGLSNTVESALWTVDWMLLAASAGIERLHFHHGVGFRYNAVQPVSQSDDGLDIDRPHILPSYHAYLIVNEAIGKSGNSYVAELPTPNGNLTAFGIWEKTQLARIVVMNTQVYLGEGEKPSINVRFDNFPTTGSAKVKMLLSEKTTDHTGLTWGGQNFNTASGKPAGKVYEEKINGGSFNLPASSIALVTLSRK